MLRLFAICEQAIAEIAFKLACGATYANGRTPSVLIGCISLNDAAFKMLNHRPSRDRVRFLKWTSANAVEKSIRYVLDTGDAFYLNVLNHSVLLNEMRVVRNEIAHKTRSTRSEYLTELARIYGVPTRLNMGPFLTSNVRHPRSNIIRYLQSVPLILNDLCRG